MSQCFLFYVILANINVKIKGSQWDRRIEVLLYFNRKQFLPCAMKGGQILCKPLEINLRPFIHFSLSAKWDSPRKGVNMDYDAFMQHKQYLKKMRYSCASFKKLKQGRELEQK